MSARQQGLDPADVSDEEVDEVLAATAPSGDPRFAPSPVVLLLRVLVRQLQQANQDTDHRLCRIEDRLAEIRDGAP